MQGIDNMKMWLSVVYLGCVVILVSGCVSSERERLMKHVRQLHGESRIAFEQQDYPAAISALRELERLAPGNPYVFYKLACVLAKNGKDEEAIAALQESARYGYDFWQHANEDPDLESIRNDGRTTSAIARMKENAEEQGKAIKDPYAAVSSEPCPTSSSVKAIIAHFAPKREQLREEGFYLGAWPTHETDWRYLRGQIDALGTYVDENPQAKDAPDAYLAIVETFTDLHQPVGFSGFVTPGTATRMRRVVKAFRAKHPKSPLLREARCVLLDAEYKSAMTEFWAVDTKDTNAWAEIKQRFGKEFASLADESIGEKTEGLALCKALRLGFARNKPELQSKLVARLRTRMEDYKEVRNMAWDNARMLLLGELGTPSFNAKDTEGNTRKLEQYSGKLLVLDFWATWCGPCLRELPEMKKLYDEFHGQGVSFLGIALEDGDSMPLNKFRGWCQEQGVTWPQLYEGKGWKHSLAKKFHITIVPTLIFIDREGKVVGEGRAHSAEHWIRKELGLQPPDCSGSTNTVKTLVD